MRVLHQAAPAASPSPSSPDSIRVGDGAGSAGVIAAAHEGLWDQRYAGSRRLPSPSRDVSSPRMEDVRSYPPLDGGAHSPFQADGGRPPLRQGLRALRDPCKVLRGELL